ncbi:MAG: YbjN domain-containing protein [Deltaproteobacteria bacterium]|nr:YbjN domain-containing protein [Deltaproteobacteria bacterium]MBN2670573.1 YbjN domain-containing protein [Deltaproteobacteria bacterium]
MTGTLEKGLAKAKKTVEAVLKEMGINAAENEVESVDGGMAWQVARGSADVMIGLVPGTKTAAGRVRVVSPIVKMDGGISKEAAVRLLALNGTELPGVAFGLIDGDMVVLVSERTVLDLNRLELQEMLSMVGYYADKYDDVLVEQFGGTRVYDLD